MKKVKLIGKFKVTSITDEFVILEPGSGIGSDFGWKFQYWRRYCKCN
jgi:hypothetical protein